MLRATWFGLLVVLVVMLLAAPALAGGWAVTELDEAVPTLTAGEPVEIGFTVLQHGVTPVVAGEVGLRLETVDGSIAAFFEAAPQGDDGHYVATVIAPRAGTWLLWAQQGATPGNDLEFDPYPLGRHEVAPSQIPSSSASEIRTPAPTTPAIDSRLAGLIGAVVGALLVVLARSLWPRARVTPSEAARSGI